MLLHACLFCIVFLIWSLPVLLGAAQQIPSTDQQYPENPTTQVNVPSKPSRLGRLPMEWIIGPYIPVQERLEPLSNTQRGRFIWANVPHRRILRGEGIFSWN